MSVLNKEKIKEYLNNESLKEKLVITPLFDHNESLGFSSVDVRLGTEFIIMRKQCFSVLDISEKEEFTKKVGSYYEKIRINFNEKLVLHPNQIVIGSTFEYIGLPNTLMCYVIGKSTWGRIGLIIATATKIDPGFKGVIALEIINSGEIPLILYPGIPIAQLVFHEVAPTNIPEGYSGSYQYAVGPQFPDFSRCYDKWKFWLPRK
jgi:dCTP deaminase